MRIRRNIDEMHVLFGKSKHECEGCKYLFREGYHYRCRKWGEHSEWSNKFIGCNLWESRDGVERLKLDHER